MHEYAAIRSTLNAVARPPATTFTPTRSTTPLIADGSSRRRRLDSPTIVRVQKVVYRELPARRHDETRARSNRRYTHIAKRPLIVVCAPVLLRRIHERHELRHE